MTLIYNYHKNTKTYTNTTTAKPCPLGGNDRIPANATTKPIPDLSDKECAVWDGSDWALGPDLRGTVYWINHYESKTITEINTHIPFDAYLTQPFAKPEGSTEEKHAAFQKAMQKGIDDRNDRIRLHLESIANL